MNNTLRNFVRRALPFVVLAMSSMTMSQQANSQEVKAISPAHLESGEMRDSNRAARPASAEESRFCYQGNEMVSCEHAAPARHEAKSEGAAPTRPMFDLNVLLGNSAS